MEIVGQIVGLLIAFAFYAIPIPTSLKSTSLRVATANGDSMNLFLVPITIIRSVTVIGNIHGAVCN